jgi:hypothetical protein
MPKKQRDELSAAALQLPLVIGAVRRASGELALAATIELNAAASAAAPAESPSLSPPLAAADAAAAAAVHALLALQALLNASLKLDVQPTSLSAAMQAASLLSATSPLALADRVVRRLHDLHSIAIALAQSASVFISSKEAELVAKAAGDAKRIANAVLPLGKGVRASIARIGEAGAEAAFAIQGERAHVIPARVLVCGSSFHSPAPAFFYSFLFNCSGIGWRGLAAAGVSKPSPPPASSSYGP